MFFRARNLHLAFAIYALCNFQGVRSIPNNISMETSQQFEHFASQPKPAGRAEITCPAEYDVSTPYTMSISVVNVLYCFSLDSTLVPVDIFGSLLGIFQSIGTALTGNPIVPLLISQSGDISELVLNAFLDSTLATQGFSRVLDVAVVNMKTVVSNRFVRKTYNDFLQMLKDVYSMDYDHQSSKRPPNNRESFENNKNKPNKKPKNRQLEELIDEDFIEEEEIFNPLKLAIDTLDSFERNLDEAIRVSEED